MPQEIGRLALRVEGEFWNAYWAPHQTTMESAILLASIRMSLVGNGGPMKAEFMALAQNAFADAVRAATGQRPTWGTPVRAPEHERGGSA